MSTTSPNRVIGLASAMGPFGRTDGGPKAPGDQSEAKAQARAIALHQ